MKRLQAGLVTAAYENGFLRRISYGDREIVRMIYFALRDHNWNTLPHHVENESIVAEADRFNITYDSRHTLEGRTILEWKSRIQGNADGSIVFEISGTMRETFRKNRAGFCVLHPLNILGQECTLTHADGAVTRKIFPADVDPENPFKNLRSMRWASAGSDFILEFEGDTFETEDQRNWSDASFKTFCTPLDKPFPVQMTAGEKVFQRIVFRPAYALMAHDPLPAYVTLFDGAQKMTLPSIGLAASTEVPILGEDHIAKLRTLRLAHYRIDLYPGQKDFASQFSSAYETAYPTGLALEVALHLSENFEEELDAFVILCKQNKVRLKKVLLLSTNSLVTRQQVIDKIQALKLELPRVLFGVGTNYNFNEVNKNRFTPVNVDFISFSIDPQEHAFDDITILENTTSPEYLVKSVRSIYGNGMAVHVSPVTLRKRFNPYATNPADLYIDEMLKADPRQKENFGAIATFGYVCSLTKGGAAAVTFYQTVGGQGVISKEGNAYPVYGVLKNLGPYQGRPVDVLESSDPLRVNAMVLDGKVIAMANLSSEAISIRWNGYEYNLGPEEIRFQPLNRAQ